MDAPSPKPLEEKKSCGVIVYVQRPSVDEPYAETLPVLAMSRMMIGRILEMRGIKDGHAEAVFPLGMRSAVDLVGKVMKLPPTEFFETRVAHVRAMLREAMGLHPKEEKSGEGEDHF